MTLGTYPTPVERLDALCRDGAELWVKRDDLTNPRYGGNKVRKLERILEVARRRGARRLVTIGAAGSHHVLATAIFGREAGFEVEAVLVPQPRTDHAIDDLRAGLAQGLVVHPAGSYLTGGLKLGLLGLRPGTYAITVGGSNVEGARAYADAVDELAQQIHSGAVPEPDVIVVTLGSGGTVAGIAAGVARAKLRARVVGVCVSKPVWAVGWIGRRLARKLERDARFELDARYLGPGYGHRTEWGDRATAIAAANGLTMDATYTAKTFAAALELVEARAAKTVLYWHTLSSAPLAPLLEGAPALPPRLERLLR